MQSTFDGESFKCLIRKGNNGKQPQRPQQKSGTDHEPTLIKGDKEDATIVVFSQNLDKAIASFIIVSGAASMGKEVTLFFTFWG